MIASHPRGLVYRCEVCGVEVAVLASQMGDFKPRCCGTAMVRQTRRLAFYACPVCGAEMAVVGDGGGTFTPRCCNTAMRRSAA